MNRIIEQRLADHLEVLQKLMDSDLPEKLETCAKYVEKALAEGHKVLFCGNGGSAADSQHLAAEFVGRFQKERKGLPAIALTVDTSILTAVANDYGYDTVFARQVQALVARQVQALGEPGDVLVGISTSGNSKNVLLAIEEARAKGITCIGMTAEGGGKMAAACDICLAVPAKVTARAQEMHILMGHILCELVDHE